MTDTVLISDADRYVSLAEIMSVRGRLGLPVERDLHFVADKPLAAYAKEAQMKGRIVT